MSAYIAKSMHLEKSERPTFWKMERVLEFTALHASLSSCVISEHNKLDNALWVQKGMVVKKLNIQVADILPVKASRTV